MSDINNSNHLSDKDISYLKSILGELADPNILEGRKVFLNKELRILFQHTGLTVDAFKELGINASETFNVMEHFVEVQVTPEMFQPHLNKVRTEYIRLYL